MQTLRTTPGVESSAMVSTLPLRGLDRSTVHQQDHPLVNTTEAPRADRYSISPDYFHTMRIPLKRGRAFTTQDRQGAPATAIISEGAARTMWPNEDAIGKHIKFGSPNDKKPWMEIVGIVGDV